MLTLNITGKSIRDSLNEASTGNENEVKILIEPSQFSETKKILESLGFHDIILEDEDGNLYVIASKNSKVQEIPKEIKIKTETEIPIEIPAGLPVALKQENKTVKPKPEIIKNSSGVLISCESQKYNFLFIRKFLASLVISRIKPDVIALINGGVKIAAYNSPTFEYLKNLASQGVKILISDSCSDRFGITEAIGVGELVDMSEILEEIFSCERLVNI